MDLLLSRFWPSDLTYEWIFIFYDLGSFTASFMGKAEPPILYALLSTTYITEYNEMVVFLLNQNWW